MNIDPNINNANIERGQSNTILNNSENDLMVVNYTEKGAKYIGWEQSGGLYLYRNNKNGFRITDQHFKEIKCILILDKKYVGHFISAG